MSAAYFYHLTRRPLEATLPMLLTKSLAAGWRVYIRGTDSERLKWLDEKLWLGTDDGFLAHGLEGGEHDADQPILLGENRLSGNGASCLISIDGAEIDPTEVKAYERVCVIFDGNDESALARARAQWKTIVDAECAAQYWSEEDGNWQKKAER
ncbi:MAG: DNA polymerase III subunit chi [Paracoccaceae bacterium]|jgi:DNA polymerase III subunit chi|nr:DNA polymerase III subunit chi [Paracoccaceae bacterium]